MKFQLLFSSSAKQTLHDLEFHADRADADKLRKVRKCLGMLESNPRHPGLATHEFRSLAGENGEKLFVAYVENHTPSAWRVFWHYGPGKRVITVVLITPHP